MKERKKSGGKGGKEVIAQLKPNNNSGETINFISVSSVVSHNTNKTVLEITIYTFIIINNNMKQSVNQQTMSKTL